MDNWRDELNNVFDEDKRKKIKGKTEIDPIAAIQDEIFQKFIDSIVYPTFRELKAEFGQHKQDVVIEPRKTYVSIRTFPSLKTPGLGVQERIDRQFDYTISVKEIENEPRIESTYRYCVQSGDPKTFMGNFSNRDYSTIIKDEIIEDVMNGFKNMMKLR